MLHKLVIGLALAATSSSVLANAYGENRPWQFPTANDTVVKMQRMEQLKALKNGTLSAGAWSGGGPIGNNITINYVIEGNNNTISNNTNNIDQDNSGDQQGIFNKDGDIINNKGNDTETEVKKDDTP